MSFDNDWMKVMRIGALTSNAYERSLTKKVMSLIAYSILGPPFEYAQILSFHEGKLCR
jgi:hypothetical protein